MMSMRAHNGLGLLLVTLTLLATACGGGVDAADRTLLREAFVEMDADQATALADGVASQTDYEAAVLRSRGCLEDAGMQLDSETLLAPDGSANVGGFLPVGRDPALVDECLDLLTPITEVYLLQHEYSDEERAAAATDAVRCLRSHGVTLPEDASLHDVVTAGMQGQGREDETVEERRACVDPLVAAAASAPPGIDELFDEWLAETG